MLPRTERGVGECVPGGRAPEERALEERVVRAVGEVARRRGATVTPEEVQAHARLDGLDPRVVDRCLRALATRGRVTRLAPTRGSGWVTARYLPPDLDATVYRETARATVREVVLAALRLLWDERDAAARVASTGRVRPPSTDDVAAHAEAGWPEVVAATGPMRRLIAATLARAADGPGAPVRRIRCAASSRVFWAPADVPDADVDVAPGLGDGERVRTAVQRAEARRGAPARSEDAWEETQAQAELRLRSRQAFSATLARESRPHGTRPARSPTTGPTRRPPPIQRVGTFGDDTFYTAGDAAGGRAYVAALHLWHDWERARADNQIEALGGATLPSVVAGRARLIAADVDGVRDRANRLARDPAARPEDRATAERVRAAATDARDALRQSLRLGVGEPGRGTHAPAPPLSEHPDDSADYWTPLEAAAALAVIAPEFGDGGDAQRVALSRLSLRVRRVPNPDVVGRRPNRVRASRAYVLNRTDTLLYGASWAGCECATQAAVARHELGALRDPRYILCDLASRTYTERLAAVACAAFCWSPAGTAALGRLARRDVDPGVRQAAAWAFGFARGAGAAELLRGTSRRLTGPVRCVPSPATPSRSSNAKPAGGGWSEIAVSRPVQPAYRPNQHTPTRGPREAYDKGAP